jgi:hypothetical protein
MTAFRTIYFRPRLALDWKIPVAALVKTPQGMSRLQAEVIPDPRCLGSVASHCVLKFGLAKVASTDNWHELPPSVGPHFELGEPRPLPDVADPLDWVKRKTLPDRSTSAGEAHASKAPTVKAIAWTHLAAWNATRYIEKSLKRGKIEEAQLVPEGIAITHYVQGVGTVLLLEPISLTQSTTETVGKIFSRFSSYLYKWQSAGTGRKPEAITYVLPSSGREEEAAMVKERLAAVSKVVFTAVADERKAFVARINKVGHQAELVGT